MYEKVSGKPRFAKGLNLFSIGATQFQNDSERVVGRNKKLIF